MSLFSPVEKVFLPLAAAPCLVLGILAHRYAMRKLQGDEKYHRRMAWIYAIVAGATLGRALFHTFAASSIPHYSLVACAWLVGMAAMDLIFSRRARVANDNPRMIAPNVGELGSEDCLIDRQTGRANSHLENTDPSLMGIQYMDAQDANAVRRTRRRITYVTVVIMTFASIMEGLLLVVSQASSMAPPSALVPITYIDKLLSSLVVYGSMLHAELPGREPYHWWQYILHYWTFTALWTLSVALSAVPVLANMPIAHATYVVNHMALALVYGIMAGALLWVAFHFMRLDTASSLSAKGRTSARLQYLYWGLCFSVAALCAATGLFL